MCIILFMVEILLLTFFYFKHKTAYEMRFSDWSSDVCSSDLPQVGNGAVHRIVAVEGTAPDLDQQLIGADHFAGMFGKRRSEERRVGKECVSTCRSRWSP